MTILKYTTDTPELKTCTKCGESFPATREYFYKRGDGLRSHCKACEDERVKRWNKENPDKRREYSKRYLEENRDKVLERKKRYREESRDKVREYAKSYHEDNANKEREYNKRWREENPEYAKSYRTKHPEKAAEYTHRRRARKSNSEGSHTAADIQEHIKSQTDKRGRLRCWWCGKVIKDSYHVDHVIPLVRGGSNGKENICIAHPKCNLSKHTKTPNEMGKLF